MHRTACLSEIDLFESRRGLSHDPQVPLGFLNEVEERVAVPIGRGQGRCERALERDKRGDQVAPMVDRACWRAQAPQAFGGFANAFASSLDRLVVDDRARASDRALQQEAGELDQAPTQQIMQRLSLAQIARDRVGQTQARLPSDLAADLRLVRVALLRTLAPAIDRPLLLVR
jgi:hypothetical protein